MNDKILERLRKEFAFVGDEKISGHTAMKIINDVVEELTIPKEVEQAQKYIADCYRDMGFMGSPEYNRQKKIVDAYAPLLPNGVLGDVFLSFVSQDDKTNLTEPFKNGNTIFATDAHSLIYTSEENYYGFFVENDKTPNCSKFLVEPNCNYNIPITDLSEFKTEDEFDEVGENIECKVCDGYGEVEWEFDRYTKDDDCPACDGSGYLSETQKVPTGNKTFGITYVKIKDVEFRIFEINRLFETAKKLNEEIVLINKPEKLSGFTFQLGKVNIMVMPCSDVNSEDVVLNIA